MAAPDDVDREALPLTGAERRQVDSVLAVADRLSHRARLELHRRLGEDLADIEPRELLSDVLARRQREALAAMAAVADAAGCPPGQAPTTTQFKRYAQELDLGWSVSRVGRAFRSWQNAQKAFTRRALPESARLVRKREHAAHGNRTHAGLLDICARWVTDDPYGATRGEYERWRERYNDRLPAGEPRAPLWRQFSRTLPELSIAEIRAAAVGEIDDPVDLARQHAEERLARDPNPLGIASSATVAALLGITQSVLGNARRRTGRAGLPRPVGFANTDPIYLIEDALRFREGGIAPVRSGTELTDEVLTAQAVAKLCGRSPKAVQSAITHDRWNIVPRPSGQIAGGVYWVRADVDSWLGEERQVSNGPSKS